MALSIKDPEADRLARMLAKKTGETITEAVKAALRERPARTRGRWYGGRRLADELDEIAKRCAALPIIDRRSPEEILRYDDRGLRN